MTVTGIEKIREYLGEYKSNYVIIGGTATNLNLDDEELVGRMTHDIDKHKKDIYRISFLIDEEHEKADVSEAIKKDMRKFIETIKDKPVNTKAIANYMGVQEITMLQFINKLHTVFSL